ncbi:MAG: cupin domain-containing protein [Rheinheimera sp.]|nr:cupin domain-containing protein [Rheinheimera sp.]
MLNMNFAERVVIETTSLPWQPSPMAGVQRKPLSRGGAESGHATSLVCYAAGSHFKAHPHPGGEEILVLDGVFSDEHGDYGPGTYLRNPPGSQHAPFSREGCLLFVKLQQFDPADQTTVRIDSKNTVWLPGHGGLQVMPLHSFEGQHTALVRWPAGEVFLPHRHFGGEEILVLSGTFCDEFGEYPALSWLRSPHQSQHTPFVREETVILVKTGHLPLL